jgi:hypothetical protein
MKEMFMYGTVARIQIRPVQVEQFLARVRELSAEVVGEIISLRLLQSRKLFNKVALKMSAM